METSVLHLKQAILNRLMQAGAFELQQEKLRFQPTAKPGQAAIGANHPMAGNYDRQRVTTVRRTHRSDRVGATNLPGDLEVTSRFTVRDGLQRIQNR